MSKQEVITGWISEFCARINKGEMLAPFEKRELQLLNLMAHAVANQESENTPDNVFLGEVVVFIPATG